MREDVFVFLDRARKFEMAGKHFMEMAISPHFTLNRHFNFIYWLRNLDTFQKYTA